MKSRKRIWSILVLSGIVATVAVWLLFSRGIHTETTHAPLSADHGQFSAGTTLSFNDAVESSQLSWSDVDRFLKRRSLEPLKASELSALDGEAGSMPGRYLHAFYSMIHERPDDAVELFDSIPLNQFPDRYLYAPYRLRRALLPDEPNRYVAPLKNAISRSALPPLTVARFLTLEGDPHGALDAYLRSDPAGWTSFDSGCLGMISQHAGLSRDLRVLVAGALRSERLRPAVAGKLKALLGSDQDATRAVVFKERLSEILEMKGAARDTAVASARRLLETRQKFLGRRYDELLESHGNSDPTAVATETALLAFLSAAALDDSSEIERWGLELKRRYPDREVELWVSQWMTESD